jgi:hypothetical protein
MNDFTPPGDGTRSISGDTHQENSFDLQRQLKDQIELLVSVRAGTPIYGINTSGAKTTITQSPDASSRNLIITNLEPQQNRRVFGVILPTEQNNRWVLLGVDNSAILLEVPQNGLQFVSTDFNPNGRGWLIQASSPTSQHRTYVDQVVQHVDTIFRVNVICDIRDNPTEMVEAINKAINFATQLAQKREQNTIDALPKVLEALKHFGQPPNETPSAPLQTEG